MTDDKIVEFKHPKVDVRSYEDNPNFHTCLFNGSLEAWATLIEYLKENNIKIDDLTALSGMISCCIEFLERVGSKEETISFLEEHLRRLKTTKNEDKI